jgi:ApaG protein
LRPGQSFEYTSGTPLPTPSGIMTGRYEMKGEGGAKFEIDIPAFSLDLPDEKPRLN